MQLNTFIQKKFFIVILNPKIFSLAWDRAQGMSIWFSFLPSIHQRVQFSVVHLVDFGLAKKYTSSATGHEEDGTTSVRIGTPKFMSANVYEKREKGYSRPSRRDDCISILFVLAYLRNVRIKKITKWNSYQI